MLYGLMTEEINYSYDGGLYGELIHNRIFEDLPVPPRRRGVPALLPAHAPRPWPHQPTPIGSLAHWAAVGKSAIALNQTNPINATALKTSVRVDITAAGGGISNDGFWGIPVKPNTEYKASFYALELVQRFQRAVAVFMEMHDAADYWRSAKTAVMGARLETI